MDNFTKKYLRILAVGMTCLAIEAVMIGTLLVQSLSADPMPVRHAQTTVLHLDGFQRT